MNNVNNVFKNTIYSIGNAAIIFCIVGVINDIAFNGNFQLENYSFTKMAIGALAIGLGFGLPTFVYDKDDMPVAIQTLIHMGIGCVVMTITAFVVGWIPTDKGIGAVLITITGEVAVAFIIWIFFYIHQKKLAKEMNKKISELNQ